jgi:adenosylcobyric acid synthase
MFLGTGSDVGKSVIAAGFCRILSKRGYRVAPFKAQNMALNSFVTMDGKEMGRAQVFQAAAAGILPESDMNPVLLKPSGDNNVQVIVQGKLYASCSARGYYIMRPDILARVLESYGRLKDRFDAIVLEGAGSAAELNLKNRDIVNMRFAILARAPVVLVGDIERGGIFASLIGTMALLSGAEKRATLGFIVNKFRGDPALFGAGVRIIERKTKRPVFGVVPYIDDLRLPEEDSVALQRKSGGNGEATGYFGGAAPGVFGGAFSEDCRKGLLIAVIRLPHIANYTDFDPFELEEGVTLRYVSHPEEAEGCTFIVIPGTKNTIHDLLWLKERGFYGLLKSHVRAGKPLAGICGGFQMLGESIEDPFGVESSRGRVRGLGFLKLRTVLEREKTLARVKGFCRIPGIRGGGKGVEGGIEIEGYEIHMGSTAPKNMKTRGSDSKNAPGTGAPLPAFSIVEENSRQVRRVDGAVSRAGNVWGTYLHGLFENDRFRAALLESLGRRGRSPSRGPRSPGPAPRLQSASLNYRAFLETQFDRLAETLERHVEIERILELAERFRRARR